MQLADMIAKLKLNFLAVTKNSLDLTCAPASTFTTTLKKKYGVGICIDKIYQQENSDQ